ncbi:hypothetical protein T01_106 [Trichinella spiralis]|uniref:Uncharacterized protein n=1 Tax=Trichinella spiralis TaxID=6334 RepID=A0A0V0Z6Q5_TRISP|nr:hypothetical protein T01_106 [Trichinella spiralis]
MLGSTIVRGGDDDPVVVGTCLEWVVCGPLLPPVSDPSCPSWSLPTQSATRSSSNSFIQKNIQSKKESVAYI